VIQSVSTPLGAYNIIGYPTEAQANAGKATLAANAKKGIVNRIPIVGPTLSGLSVIGDFFQRITQANTWIRAGEVLLGLILIGVGLAHMTGVVPAASKLASKVGATAAMAA